MGNITRKEAERQLLAADNEAGAFLIRESASYLGDLSFYDSASYTSKVFSRSLCIIGVEAW